MSILHLFLIIEEDTADGLSDEDVGHGETYTLGCIFKVGDDVRQVLYPFVS